MAVEINKNAINIVFACAGDDNDDLVFIDTHNDAGESISIGEWKTDSVNGYTTLRIAELP